jgi:glutamyl-tRNA reductase
MSVGILVIGLNHSTAPVRIRERITFPGNVEGRVNRILAEGTAGVEEIMILSTCNRAEVIAITEDSGGDERGRLIDLIAAHHSLDRPTFEDYLYVKEAQEAVRHVFRVASSLDSMVLGEAQILGQVKDGYRLASEAETTGPILNRLMHRAFFAAKRVRTETNIGAAAVSVAYVAVELAKKILGELRDKSVLLIGAGEMAELAARHLINQVDKPITVVNRTFENACTLATQLDGRAMKMDELEQALLGADVVITSTGSCEPIIGDRDMKKVMKMRRYRPIFLIDIAIPRDVAPEVNDIDGVYLYNIDDLQAVVSENLGERRQEAIRGAGIVEEEVTKFMNWTKTLDATPTIIALLEKLEGVRSSELTRLNGKLSRLNPQDRETVEIITRSIINKIAHDPISFLKKARVRAKRNDYLDITQRMFNLNGLKTDPEPGEEDIFDK